MSGKAMGWALEQSTELPVDKLVLIAIANFADEHHQCFPSRKTLAKLAMCSVDTVDRSIRRLIEAKMLAKDQRLADRGGLKSNCYSLPVGEYSPAAHNPLRGGSRNLRPGGHPQSAATLAACTAATLAATGAATKGTVTEPSIEPTPKPPQGASTNASQIDWRTAFATKDDHAGIEVTENGDLVLVNGTRQHWLEEFGNDERALGNALREAHAAVNEGSRKSLKVQVEATLARIVRDMTSRQKNYLAAAAAKAEPKRVKLSRWGA
jgi:hypothetical protein